MINGMNGKIFIIDKVEHVLKFTSNSIKDNKPVFELHRKIKDYTYHVATFIYERDSNTYLLMLRISNITSHLLKTLNHVVEELEDRYCEKIQKNK